MSRPDKFPDCMALSSKREACLGYRETFTRLDLEEKENARLRKGIQDYLDGNYDHPRAHRHEPAMGCKHGRKYYEECAECDSAYFSALLGEENVALGQGLEKK